MAKRIGLKYYTDRDLFACRMMAEGRGPADVKRAMLAEDDTWSCDRMYLSRLRKRAEKDGLALDVTAGLVEPPAEPPPPMDAAAAQDLEDVVAGAEGVAADARTPIEQLEEVHALLLATALEASRAGNATVAGRAGKAAGDMIGIMLRARREQRLANEGVLVTAEELLTTRAKLRDILTALHSRPLLCAHCSRALSVDWGGANKDDAHKGA